MAIRRRSARAARTGSVLLGFYALAAGAIDAPKPDAVTAPAASTPAPQAEVKPTDESAFYERLQFVQHKRNLTGLNVSTDAIKALSSGAADVAVATLSSQTAAGNPNSNIALVRIQHWCNRITSSRPTDSKAQLARLAQVLPPERLARAAGVYAAERSYQERARQGCAKARFDYAGIEARLREAAEAGDPASATELAQFVRDPKQREELLQHAADKNFAPAMYALATNRLIAVQRGQTTENVGTIRLLLKQAGLTLSRAKVDLANCVALGCDGHPANTATAAAFGTDAARDGEPLAFLSMMRMPWGGRLNRVELLAWQSYGDRLNEMGCTGEAYVQTSATFTQSLKALERGQDASVLEQAKAQLETLWQQNGERARKEQGCD